MSIRRHASFRQQAGATSGTTLSGQDLLQNKRAAAPTGGRDEISQNRSTAEPRAPTDSGLETRNERLVPGIVREVLRSPGKPLDAATRAFMEPRFGHDFSHVRVHTDAKAAESAQALNACAYTVGSAVVFGSGQFAPETSRGRQLIAHELPHTIQQASADILSISPLTVVPPGHPTEREADAAAHLVLAGHSAERLFEAKTRARAARTPQAPVLQFQPEEKSAGATPKSFREKLDGFIARKNALRSQLDLKASSLQFTTTVVGIYSNDAFKQWEPWRKEIMKIGNAASNLKEEIMNAIVDAGLTGKAAEEALSVAESVRFIFIDATRTVVPASTTVTVIQRVDSVTFVTAGVVKGKSLELQEWLDKIKADYESASKQAPKGSKPSTSGSQPPASGD